MILIPQLAVRNILGAGLRTWLNVIVLSLAFVAIILSVGFNRGLLQQASTAMIDAELGGGQYWQGEYDPYDPFTLQDAHAEIPEALANLISSGKATAILAAPGTLYPDGRILPVTLRGIDPHQTILEIPSRFLDATAETPQALIGARMAKSGNLGIGDYVTVRWRDRHGTYDARDIVITQIMNTTVPTVDTRQVWLPLRTLQEMTNMPDQATLVVLDKNQTQAPEVAGWSFMNLDFLLKDLHDLVKTRLIARSVLYVILLFLAMIAIFDTQILAIFRRRKEIGTLIAMGMTRSKVIQLFTLEGMLHGVLAAGLGAIYGTPLLAYFAKNGFEIPQSGAGFGLAIGRTLYPYYSTTMVVGTTALVMLVVTVVSFIPTRRIAKLNPTDALRGKIT